MHVLVTVEAKMISQSTKLQIQDACLATSLLGFVNLNSLTYQVGSSKLTQSFTTNLDTISELFLTEQNIPKACGEQVVECELS